jgi:hypothetical protein
MSGIYHGGVFGSRNQGSQPKALAGVQVQTSVYGVGIPIVYGQARIAGNLIWANDFVSTGQKTGKGGGTITGYTYRAAIALALCEGPIYGIVNTWTAKVQTLFSTLVSQGFSLFGGASAPSPWGYVTTNHPTEALGYQFTAYIARSDWPLDAGATMANYTWEIQGFLPFGGGIIDANPADIVLDFLAVAQYGAGVSPSQFANITAFRDYCSAAGLFMSPVVDTQRSAGDYLKDWLSSCNSEVVWSGGLFKFVPYGDTALSANGATFTPVVTPLYDLTDDDFVVQNPGDDPIKVKRATPADAFNQVTVEFENRTLSYNTETASAFDQAAIEVNNLRPMPVVTAHWIKDPAVARVVAQLILQRQINLRNKYEFSLSWKYCLLEPMDLVSINDAVLGLVAKVVRVTEITEDEFGGLAIIAEDFQLGTGDSAVYPSETGSGTQTAQGASPGNST